MADTYLEARLEQLLSESPHAAERRERSTFDELASPFESRLVLFGSGGLGRRTLAGLRQAGVEPLAFTDNNPALWGEIVDGLRVLAPDQAASQFGNSAAFVVTIWNGEASDGMSTRVGQLAGLGCRRVIPFAFLFWKYSDVFLPHYLLDRPKDVLESKDAVRKALQLWADEQSREEYVRQITFRLWMDFDQLTRPAAGVQYFSSGLFSLSDEEVFVDCGAFDGDTIRSFIRLGGGRFAAVIAFEPDPMNWPKLEQFVSALPSELQRKMAIARKAIGARTESVRFNASGTLCSSVGTGNDAVDCVDLDHALSGRAPTLIKFDIEGSELDALAGGAHMISMCKPVIAISVYHRQDHLWKIPIALAALSGSYKLYLRPEGTEGWDLNCYAVPPGRNA